MAGEDAAKNISLLGEERKKAERLKQERNSFYVIERTDKSFHKPSLVITNEDNFVNTMSVV